MDTPCNMLLNVISPWTKVRGRAEVRFQKKKITISFLDVSFGFQLMLFLEVRVEDLFQGRDGI